MGCQTGSDGRPGLPGWPELLDPAHTQCTLIGLYRFLVSVSVSGQSQQFLMVSESVKYVIQVPIPIVIALSIVF